MAAPSQPRALRVSASADALRRGATATATATATAGAKSTRQTHLLTERRGRSFCRGPSLPCMLRMARVLLPQCNSNGNSNSNSNSNSNRTEGLLATVLLLRRRLRRRTDAGEAGRLQTRQPLPLPLPLPLLRGVSRSRAALAGRSPWRTRKGSGRRCGRVSRRTVGRLHGSWVLQQPGPGPGPGSVLVLGAGGRCRPPRPRLQSSLLRLQRRTGVVVVVADASDTERKESSVHLQYSTVHYCAVEWSGD